MRGEAAWFSYGIWKDYWEGKLLGLVMEFKTTIEGGAAWFSYDIWKDYWGGAAWFSYDI